MAGMMATAAWQVAPATGKSIVISLFLVTLAGCGGGGGGSSSSDEPPPTSIVTVEYQEVQAGGASDSEDVTTSAQLAAASGQLYLAAVSSNPPRDVISVEGLGLSWFPVGVQCSARGITGVSVWRAMGSPDAADKVTARLDSISSNAVIAVSRYSGIDATEPLGALISANTHGLEGACTGGSDSLSYSMDMMTSAPGSLVYAAAAIRNRSHSPGAGYAERTEIRQGEGGATAAVAVQDAVFETLQTTSITGEFNSDVDWAVIAIELKPEGSSIPLPDIGVDPASHDYRTVLISTSKPQAFSILNEGAADLNVSGTSIAGADADEFIIDAGHAPFSLAPGSNHLITVNIAPNRVGLPSAFLRIVSDDPDESPLDVALTGKVVDTIESDIVVDPASHEYGYVNIATGATKTFQVRNEGLADLYVQTTGVSGTDMSLFTIDSGTAPFTVAPDAAKNIAVSFNPVAEISASATLEITSDDADQPRVDVPLSGSGQMIEGGIWISAEELASLPMSGWAWDDLKKEADAEPDRQPMSKLASDHDTQTLAIGLVYARMGDEYYREKALTEIKWAMGTEEDSAQAVGPCRNVVPYIITADLIDLENYDPAFGATFRNWIDEMRFVIWPDGSMIDEDEERTNNHGRMCGAARAAIAVYLGDQVELDRTATVFAGVLGDQSAYDEFHWKHDLSWQADETNPVGVNPVGAVKQGLSIDGALTEEMRRGGEFQIPPIHTGYPWEALQGILVEAVILERAGYFGVFDWSDRAILRIVEFIERLDNQYPDDGWWATGDDTWVPWVINDIYGRNFPTQEAHHGKLMAWTDWTHAP